MKFFLDFFPVILFVGVYSYFYTPIDNIAMYPAVKTLMVASVLQNIATKLITNRFEKLHLWGLVITLLMGGLTLLLKNPVFIFWKATAVVWLTAAVFIYRQYVLNKILIKEMLGKAFDEHISVPEELWKKLNNIWAFSYIVYGIVNLLVAYNVPESTWVIFKLVGLLVLNFALLGYILFKIFPYFPEEDEAEDEEKETATSKEEM